MLSEAERALGFEDRSPEGTPEHVVRHKKPAAAMRWFALDEALTGSPKETGLRRMSVPRLSAKPSGGSTLAMGERSAEAVLADRSNSGEASFASAAIANSAVLGAGGRLIVLTEAGRGHERDKSIFVGSAGAVGFGEVIGELVSIDPLILEETAEEDEFPTYALSTFAKSVKIRRSGLMNFGVTTTLSRAQRFEMGLDQAAATIASAIAAGLGRAIDKAVFDALLAAPVSTGTMQSAAAAGLRFEDLRGIIGTTVTTKAVADRGALFLDGVPASLTDQSVTSFLGDWSRIGVATEDTATVIANRANTKGDLIVTAHLGLGVLLPDTSAIWAIDGTVSEE